MLISNGTNLIDTLNTGQILLGLDIGDKSIGVALSDKNLIIGSPLKTIYRKGGLKDIDSMRIICNEFNVGGIIIGLPLSLDGQENIRTKKTREFAKKLSSSLSLDYYFQDERFSTAVVTKEMRKNSLSNKKIKKHVDHSAAAYILQGFLDKYLRNL
tara:strand:- start:109 stop:576 length:468 start_codon:yes stop_codon:yes gene_type:complete